jgi:hypothetical protein
VYVCIVKEEDDPSVNWSGTTAKWSLSLSLSLSLPLSLSPSLSLLLALSFSPSLLLSLALSLSLSIPLSPFLSLSLSLSLSFSLSFSLSLFLVTQLCVFFMRRLKSVVFWLAAGERERQSKLLMLFLQNTAHSLSLSLSNYVQNCIWWRRRRRF